MKLIKIYLLVIGLIFSILSTNAQTNNCATILPWTNYSVYQGGAQIKYNGVIYRAKWYSSNDVPGVVTGPWESLGNCTGDASTTPINCSPYTSWTAKDYAAGSQVLYNGNLLTARNYASASQVPGTVGGPWDLTAICTSATSGGSTGSGSTGGTGSGTTSPTTYPFDCAVVLPFVAANVYNTGDKVKYQGTIYIAKWYTQSQNPLTPYSAWQSLGVCTGDTLTIATDCGACETWSASVVYNAGDKASFNNRLYKARWYSKGDIPGSAGPWDLIGICDTKPGSAGRLWSLIGNNRVDSTQHFLGTIFKQPLVVKTNSKEALRVSVQGNVGIGTAYPNYNLDVNGTIAGLYLKVGNGGTLGKVLVSDDQGFAKWNDAPLVTWTIVGNNIYNLNTGGNVGIGTTTPQALLDVNGYAWFRNNVRIDQNVVLNQRAEIGSDGSKFNIPLTLIKNGDAGGSDNSALWIKHSGIGVNVFGNTATDLGQIYLSGFNTSTANKMINSHGNFVVYSNGNVAIGDSYVPTGYRLGVNGKIVCTEVLVKNRTNWPDYVFEDGYNLNSLKDVENYIFKNKHLPEIPSAEEVESYGVTLGEMNAKLLKKVEELTLYLIDLNKKIEKQESKTKILQMELEKLNSK